MFTHMVHVEYKNIQRYVYGVNGGREIIEAHIPPNVKVDFALHEDQQEEHGTSIRTFYVSGLKEAEKLAKFFAEQTPGATVYVLETKAIALSPIQPANLSAVTEKGIVPR